MNLAIKDRDIPDVMVVRGRETLEELVRQDLVADLTGSYEECTTDRCFCGCAGTGSGSLV